jgi:hypothetical protein
MADLVELKQVEGVLRVSGTCKAGGSLYFKIPAITTPLSVAVYPQTGATANVYTTFSSYKHVQSGHASVQWDLWYLGAITPSSTLKYDKYNDRCTVVKVTSAGGTSYVELFV